MVVMVESREADEAVGDPVLAGADSESVVVEDADSFEEPLIWVSVESVG